MDRPTLYMETTIPSYLLAEPSSDNLSSARQEVTRKWWRRDRNRFDVFVSDVVLEEAIEGNREAATKRRDFLGRFPMLSVTPEADALIQVYIDTKIVPAHCQRDAAHLALATLHEMQFLCTWNFRHLANAFALKRFRQLNEDRGLFVPQVCTPEALLGE